MSEINKVGVQLNAMDNEIGTGSSNPVGRVGYTDPTSGNFQPVTLPASDIVTPDGETAQTSLAQIPGIQTKVNNHCDTLVTSEAGAHGFRFNMEDKRMEFFNPVKGGYEGFDGTGGDDVGESQNFHVSGSGANLLINSNFRNPVNQRVQREITSNGYFIDRWAVISGKATLTSRGITLESGSASMSLYQYIEFPELYDGLTMTVSANVGETIYHATGTFVRGVDSGPSVSIDSEFQLSIISDESRRLRVSFIGTGVITDIRWVKLELGEKPTPFMPRHFAEELALCQRYYEKSYDINTLPGTSGARGRIYFSTGVLSNGLALKGSTAIFKVTKRTRPTVAIYDQLGNAGKISTLDAHGNRTDAQNYKYLTIGNNAFELANDGTSGGHLYFWVADAEL